MPSRTSGKNLLVLRAFFIGNLYNVKNIIIYNRLTNIEKYGIIEIYYKFLKKEVYNNI